MRHSALRDNAYRLDRSACCNIRRGIDHGRCLGRQARHEPIPTVPERTRRLADRPLDIVGRIQAQGTKYCGAKLMTCEMPEAGRIGEEIRSASRKTRRSLPWHRRDRGSQERVSTSTIGRTALARQAMLLELIRPGRRLPSLAIACSTSQPCRRRTAMPSSRPPPPSPRWHWAPPSAPARFGLALPLARASHRAGRKANYSTSALRPGHRGRPWLGRIVFSAIRYEVHLPAQHWQRRRQSATICRSPIRHGRARHYGRRANRALRARRLLASAKMLRLFVEGGTAASPDKGRSSLSMNACSEARGVHANLNAYDAARPITIGWRTRGRLIATGAGFPVA